MINLFYRCNFKENYKLHEYVEIDIRNDEKIDIEKNMVLFLDIQSYKAFIGIVIKNTNKALVKIVSNIFQVEDEMYNSINEITQNGLLEYKDIKLNINYELVIVSLVDYMEICEVINKSKYPYKNSSEYLYRGQSNKEWELTPSIFRAKVDNKKEQDLYKDIRQWNIEQFSSGDFLKDSCNMQHYGIPTRLMDWTSNALHALYFAVTGSSEKDKDGEVLCVDIDKIHDIDSNEYKQINDFLMYRYEGDKYEKLELNDVNKLLTEFSLNKKRYMFFKTKYFNDRIKRQQGYFSIYIDITEEEANDVRKMLLEYSIEDMMKSFKKLDIGFTESDYENIRKIILKEVVCKYNKYTEMNALQEGIAKIIEEYMNNRGSVNFGSKINEVINKSIKDSNLEKVKYKEHRMEEILKYQNYIKIIIPKEVKEDITKALDGCGVNSRVIYPDIEGLARYMKEKYQ